MITKSSCKFEQRITPETSGQLSQPAVPLSTHSAPLPYQNTDQTIFLPETQLVNNYSHSGFSETQHPDQINWEQSQYNQKYNKPNQFYSYNMPECMAGVSSSSPLNRQPCSQPTSLLYPYQCDKCGFISNSAMQLNQHCNNMHAACSSALTANMIYQQLQGKEFNNTVYQSDIKIKEEHKKSPHILDLDSQKVVCQGNEEEQLQSNISFEQALASGREVDSRTLGIFPWESQKFYINQPFNGDISLFQDQKMLKEQKVHPYEVNMFHADQKFAYVQENFYDVHHEHKTFMHVDRKIYTRVQMPQLTDSTGTVGSSNAELKQLCRSYVSSASPQPSSSQSTITARSTGRKGAHGQHNEARRPKTYTCTACNKWFTSSGHLKRHYNTTLHKNTERSSGKSYSATMPISNRHHPSQISSQHTQLQAAESKSPLSREDVRSVNNNGLQSAYALQGFERLHGDAAIQSKSPYMHLQQGITDNSFSYNTLANHSLQYQVDSQSYNVIQSPHITLNLNDNVNPVSKTIAITTTENSINGEVVHHVSQNHLTMDLMSIPNNNISTPVTTQTTALTVNNEPPFKQLGVNMYSPRSTDLLGPTVPGSTHTSLNLEQNFQQTIASSPPNEMAPHVMDTATSNQPIASLATFGESIPDEVVVNKQETSIEVANVRLPSFAELKAQRFGMYVSNNNITSPNVEGPIVNNELTDSYNLVNLDSPTSQLSSNNLNQRTADYELSAISKPTYKILYGSNSPAYFKDLPYGYAMDDKTIKREVNGLRPTSSELKILNIENIMDYTNKENYDIQMKLPASPESAKADNENRCSPSAVTPVTSTNPLSESNKIKKCEIGTIHKCFECNKLFNKACYLTQHNKTFHCGVKPFKCERCGKRFSDDDSQKQHSLKHGHDKPFKCNICPKDFNHKTDLRRHMCLHLDTKPFACEYCDKGFVRRDHMLKHVETHKKKSLR